MSEPRARRDSLKRVVRRFRILRDWDVRWSRQKYRGQCTIHPTLERAVIYPWGQTSSEPEDYRLHEVLHCALRALVRMDGRKPKEQRLAEEQLVQDICAMLRKPNVTPDRTATR